MSREDWIALWTKLVEAGHGASLDHAFHENMMPQHTYWIVLRPAKLSWTLDELLAANALLDPECVVVKHDLDRCWRVVAR